MKRTVHDEWGAPDKMALWFPPWLFGWHNLSGFPNSKDVGLFTVAHLASKGSSKGQT
jgi:hypothetical protein